MSSYSRIVFPVSRILLPYLFSTSILSILQEPGEILPLFLKHSVSPQPNVILAPVFQPFLVIFPYISFFSYYLPYYSDNLKVRNEFEALLHTSYVTHNMHSNLLVNRIKNFK